jgi:hypothetical protein
MARTLKIQRLYTGDLVVRLNTTTGKPFGGVCVVFDDDLSQPTASVTARLLREQYASIDDYPEVPAGDTKVRIFDGVDTFTTLASRLQKVLG